MKNSLHHFSLAIFLSCWILCVICEITDNTQIRTNLIMKGMQGMMNCGFENETLQFSKPSYHWSYHGRPQFRYVHFDEKEGSFYIDKAEPKDSGLYDCSETGKNDAKAKVSRTKHHRLIVFVVPDVTLKFEDVFLVDSCQAEKDNNARTSFQKYLCEGTKNGSCPFEVSQDCKRVISNENVEKSQNQKLLNVTIRLLDFIPPLCDSSCVRLNLAMHLDRLQKLFENKRNSSITSTIFQNYDPKPALSKKTLVEKCPFGFVPFANSICAPCEPGTFWHEGKCVPCPRNTYQDEGGAVIKCKECPSGLTTVSDGSNHLDNCKKDKSVTVTKIDKSVTVTKLDKSVTVTKIDKSVIVTKIEQTTKATITHVNTNHRLEIILISCIVSALVIIIAVVGTICFMCNKSKLSEHGGKYGYGSGMNYDNEKSMGSIDSQNILPEQERLIKGILKPSIEERNGLDDTLLRDVDSTTSAKQNQFMGQDKSRPRKMADLIKKITKKKHEAEDKPNVVDYHTPRRGTVILQRPQSDSVIQNEKRQTMADIINSMKKKKIEPPQDLSRDAIPPSLKPQTSITNETSPTRTSGLFKHIAKNRTKSKEPIHEVDAATPIESGSGFFGDEHMPLAGIISIPRKISESEDTSYSMDSKIPSKEKKVDTPQYIKEEKNEPEKYTTPSSREETLTSNDNKPQNRRASFWKSIAEQGIQPKHRFPNVQVTTSPKPKSPIGNAHTLPMKTEDVSNKKNSTPRIVESPNFQVDSTGPSTRKTFSGTHNAPPNRIASIVKTFENINKESDDNLYQDYSNMSLRKKGLSDIKKQPNRNLGIPNIDANKERKPSSPYPQLEETFPKTSIRNYDRRIDGSPTSVINQSEGFIIPSQHKKLDGNNQARSSRVADILMAEQNKESDESFYSVDSKIPSERKKFLQSNKNKNVFRTTAERLKSLGKKTEEPKDRDAIPKRSAIQEVRKSSNLHSLEAKIQKAGLKNRTSDLSSEGSGACLCPSCTLLSKDA